METPGIPHPLEDVNDWKTALKWPDPYSWDWDESARINNDNLKNNGKANILWFLNGMGFERLISFMGFENAAMALLDEDQEDALHELLHALTDLHLTLVKLCCDTYGEGLTGFCLHDDWGSQKSPFFSVAAGRDFFVDEWKRFTSYVHSLGRIADLHSCGHIEAQRGGQVGSDRQRGRAVRGGQEVRREVLQARQGRRLQHVHRHPHDRRVRPRRLRDQPQNGLIRYG